MVYVYSKYTHNKLIMYVIRIDRAIQAKVQCHAEGYEPNVKFILLTYTKALWFSSEDARRLTHLPNPYYYAWICSGLLVAIDGSWQAYCLFATGGTAGHGMYPHFPRKIGIFYFTIDSLVRSKVYEPTANT